MTDAQPWRSWERVATLGPALSRRLRIDAAIIAVGAAAAAGLGVATIYLPFTRHGLVLGELVAGLVFLGGLGAYLVHRPAARQVVWPAESPG